MNRRGLQRFSQSGKLTPRIIGPFEILDRIGVVAHHLALLPQLPSVHNVFQVLILRKYYPDPSQVLDWTVLPLSEDASYEEQPIRILEEKDCVLRGRVIALVRIQWNNYCISESTWEDESEASKSYPHLFPRVV